MAFGEHYHEDLISVSILTCSTLGRKGWPKIENLNSINGHYLLQDHREDWTQFLTHKEMYGPFCVPCVVSKILPTNLQRIHTEPHWIIFIFLPWSTGKIYLDRIKEATGWVSERQGEEIDKVERFDCHLFVFSFTLYQYPRIWIFGGFQL